MKSEDLSQRSVPGFDLLDLTLFVAVVRAGSITHGAREVHLALPSASARIRAMETALGTSLLDREHRGVKPTPAGHLLLRHARSVLYGVDHLREDLAQYAADLVSTIEVQANSTAIATFLPGVLTTFLIARPDINVDLKACPSRDIVRAVRDGRADAGVVADTIDTGTLERIVLHHDELVRTLGRTYRRYLGSYGWIGFDLVAGEAAWQQVRELIDSSYRNTAATRLVAELDSG